MVYEKSFTAAFQIQRFIIIKIGDLYVIVMDPAYLGTAMLAVIGVVAIFTIMQSPSGATVYLAPQSMRTSVCSVYDACASGWRCCARTCSCASADDAEFLRILLDEGASSCSTDELGLLHCTNSKEKIQDVDIQDQSDRKEALVTIQESRQEKLKPSEEVFLQIQSQAKPAEGIVTEGVFLA